MRQEIGPYDLPSAAVERWSGGSPEARPDDPLECNATKGNRQPNYGAATVFRRRTFSNSRRRVSTFSNTPLVIGGKLEKFDFQPFFR